MHTFFFFLIKEVCALTPSPSRGLGRGWGKNGENSFVFHQKDPSSPQPAQSQTSLARPSLAGE